MKTSETSLNRARRGSACNDRMYRPIRASDPKGFKAAFMPRANTRRINRLQSCGYP